MQTSIVFIAPLMSIPACKWDWSLQMNCMYKKLNSTKTVHTKSTGTNRNLCVHCVSDASLSCVSGRLWVRLIFSDVWLSYLSRGECCQLLLACFFILNLQLVPIFGHLFDSFSPLIYSVCLPKACGFTDNPWETEGHISAVQELQLDEWATKPIN